MITVINAQILHIIAQTLKIILDTSPVANDIAENNALAEMKIDDNLDFFIISAYNMSGGCEWDFHPHHLLYFLSIITAIIAVIVVIMAHIEVIHS